MKRFAPLILITAIVALCMGAYHCFLGITTFPSPTSVSLAELDGGVPFNRHLKISDAVPLLDEGVMFYRTRNHAKVEGSECTFFPLQEKGLSDFNSLTPTILVRVSQPLLGDFIEGAQDQAFAIQGVRLTGWDLPKEAKNLLVKRWGEPSIGSMLVVDYKRGLRDLEKAFSNFVVGGLLLWLFFYIASRS
jgi:hypothetical protein